MKFAPDLRAKVLDGTKTQTWRPLDERSRIISDYKNKVFIIEGPWPDHIIKWRIGDGIEVEPNEAGEVSRFIKITGLVPRTPIKLDSIALRLEGFGRPVRGRPTRMEMFLARLDGFYPDVKPEDIPTMPGVSIVFELVEGMKR